MASEYLDRGILALLLSTPFAWISFRLQFLSLSGFIAAAILGAVILGVGGWSWVFPLLTFFVFSSLLSKLRGNRGAETVEARGSRRDAVQVLANGGLAGAIALAQAISGGNLYPVYLGALAASTADTWSTEIGLLGGAEPRRITDWQPVSPGTSGGVTAFGVLGALLGASLIAIVGLMAAPLKMTSVAVLPITAAGLGGSLFDSFLGASIQQRRRCRICTGMTEKKFHCNSPTEFVGGWRLLNNDGVNVLCSAFGASASALMLI